MKRLRVKTKNPAFYAALTRLNTQTSVKLPDMSPGVLRHFLRTHNSREKTFTVLDDGMDRYLQRERSLKLKAYLSQSKKREPTYIKRLRL